MIRFVLILKNHFLLIFKRIFLCFPKKAKCLRSDLRKQLLLAFDSRFILSDLIYAIMVDDKVAFDWATSRIHSTSKMTQEHCFMLADNITNWAIQAHRVPSFVAFCAYAFKLGNNFVSLQKFLAFKKLNLKIIILKNWILLSPLKKSFLNFSFTFMFFFWNDPNFVLKMNEDFIKIICFIRNRCLISVLNDVFLPLKIGALYLLRDTTLKLHFSCFKFCEIHMFSFKKTYCTNKSIDETLDSSSF